MLTSKEISDVCADVKYDLEKIDKFRTYYAEAKGFKLPEATPQLLEKMKSELDKMEICEVVGNTLRSIARYSSGSSYPPEATIALKMYLVSKAQLCNLVELQNVFLELKQQNINYLTYLGGTYDPREHHISGLLSSAREKYHQIYEPYSDVNHVFDRSIDELDKLVIRDVNSCPKDIQLSESEKEQMTQAFLKR